MALIFHLSGENIELARAEVEAFSSKPSRLDGPFLILDSSFTPFFRRLAFTHKVGKLLFDSSPQAFMGKFKSFNWRKVYAYSYSIRAFNSLYSEKELAAIIWFSLDRPKVDLMDAKTRIEVAFTKRKVYVYILLHENNEKFEQRKAHKRPGFQPISLHPKLARALVNLTGVKKGKLVDPLCGTGGILIEAGLMGVKSVGYDISDSALDKCGKNLAFFKIYNCELKKVDSTKVSEGWEYVATDLPYGKSTSVVSVERFYSDFLKNLKNNLKKRAVLVFPHFVDYKRLIKKSKLKIKKEISHYIHKSLTRKIVLLEA